MRKNGNLVNLKKKKKESLNFILPQLVIKVTFCNNYRIFVIKSSHFVITVAFCNKTIAFCNKKPDAFCNRLLSHFVIK